MKTKPFHPESLEARFLLASAAYDLIGVTDARNDPAFSSIDGGGVSVAVIDTGLDVNHPLIAPNFVAGVDIVSGANSPTVVNPHGTHVAGIVGSRPDAGRNYDGGVAPGVGLIGLNVFSQTSGGDVSADNRTIERALQWVLNNRARYNIVAVNMSLGSGFYTSQGQVSGDLYRDEIASLESAGVTVVSAAGNTYGVVRDSGGQQYDLQFPNSSSPGIISTLNVGAVWEANEGGGFFWSGGNTVDVTTGPDRVVSFSQRPPTGVGNAVFAPGAIIRSTWPGNQLHETQGTSMASPMVAGAVALLQDASLSFGGRLLSPVEVRDVLQQTGDVIVDGDDEDDALFIDANNNGVADSGEVTSLRNTGNTYRRVNVYSALKRVRELFGGGGGGGGTNARDPNGTISGAIIGPALTGSPLDAIEGVLGSDGTVSVGNRDVDIYRFTVVTGGEVAIEVAPSAANPGADFNSYLRLFRANGTQLAADDNGGAGDWSLIKRQLTPGTYYVGVSGAGNTSYNPATGGGTAPGKTGRFRVGFSLKNVDPNGVVGGAVAVNLTTAGEEPAVFNGFIGADFGKEVGVSDVDLFKIVVPDDGTLLVDVDTPFDQDFVDTYLRIFDESLAQVGLNDDGFATDILGNRVEFNAGGGITVDGSNAGVGHTTDSFVTAGVQRGKTYYIGISDFQNQSYNPGDLGNRATGGTGGFYNVSIDFVNNDRNGSIAQSVNVSTLPLTDQLGLIGFDGTNAVGNRDVDLLKIRPAAEGLLEIRGDSFSLAGNADPVDLVLMLFDAAGTRLAQVDDVNGADPALRIRVPANADYYVGFSGKGNDSYDPFILGSGAAGDTGEYRINIRLLDAGAGAAFSDDTAASAAVRALSLGATITSALGLDAGGYVSGDDDVDVYKFVATSSGLVEIKAFTQDAFGADTVLRLFSAGGSELAFSDNDSAGTVNSRIQYNVTAGKTYFVGVSGAGPSARSYDVRTGSGRGEGSTGNYVLSLDGQFAKAGASRVVIEGTPGNDRFRVVQSSSTVISVFRGKTELRFSDSQMTRVDAILGDGNDVLTVEPGLNEPLLVDAGAGNDSIAGGDGNDTITGGAGKNTLLGGNGDDRLNGSGGRDLLLGQAGNDRLYGRGGNDTMDGGGGVDRLCGEDGDDSLVGASSNDKLYGDAGNDTLIGAAGSDLLDGGPGADVSDDDANDTRTSIESLL